MTEESTNRGIPRKGMSADEILRRLDSFRKKDISWEEGKTWSLVYHAGDEHDALLKKASEKYFSSNYLNPFAFAGLQEMERQIVRMTRELLNGDEQVVGSMTSGGTESLLLAMYTYREWARKHKPEIREPEIIAPATIHPAHDKAAHLFGLRIRKAKVDADQCAIPSEIEKQITKNTILLCASAPSYPHGILDPIGEIAGIAIKNRLPMHVDSCIGGFMLPWVEALGYPVEPWDFRVPGVTSISADIHKFGYGAKGASVLLFRNMGYMEHQFFIETEFPGGIYASATLLGTRAGSAIAAAWSGMMHMGQDGYMAGAKQLMAGRDKLKGMLDAIPELRVIGDPCMNIISYATERNKPDLFAIADHLEKTGWLVDRQQYPDSIHLTLLPTNVHVIDQYVRDLQEAIRFSKANPQASGKGNAAIYGMMARVPMRGMVKNNVRQVFEQLYGAAQGDLSDGQPEEPIAPVRPWMSWLSRLLAYLKRF